MTITIGQLPLTTGVVPTTQIPVETDNVTQKIYASSLKDFISASLPSVNTTGNVNGGNVIASSGIYGNISSPTQLSITRVGTLTLLSVSGNSTVGNIVPSATNTFNIGASDSIFANLFVGNITATNIAGQVTTASQSHITGLGTLTILNISGNANVTGNTNVTANINAAGYNNLSGITLISNTTSSTDETTGALVVAGGAGIAGNVNVAQRLNVTGRATVTGNLVAASGIGSSDTTTGALVVRGGIGVSGSINAGGSINVVNTVSADVLSGSSASISGNVTTGNVSGTKATFSTFAGSGALLVNIPNSGLVNSSITINGSAVALGGSVTLTTGVSTITGTANQITANVSTGNIGLSLPQSISTTSGVQFGSIGVGTAASGTTGEIRATNNVTAYYTSDRRYKENIRTIPDALDKVVSIGGKLFDWSEEYISEHGGADGYFVRKNDFGVIAQDVEAVLPEAVRTRDNGTLAVDYEKLCSLAFAAIAELKAEIEQLKSGQKS
jgi:hypothetical protein